MKLLRKAQPPEITARAVLLLLPAFRQAAIKSLHEDKHAGQQQTIKMARDRYIWPGMESSKSLSKCQSEDQLAQACQARILPSKKTPFKMVHIDLVGLLHPNSD